MILCLALLSNLAGAAENAAPNAVVDQMQSARTSISQTEKAQREALSHLFVINKHIKDIAKKRAKLTERLMDQEASVRVMAHEVSDLETKSEQHKVFLNKRLRQLYQEQKGTDFQWLFSAQTPVEMERNHRFLKLMIDSDHQQLKKYLVSLKEVRSKRTKLKGLVASLSKTQKEVQGQEDELGVEMRNKSKLLASLKKSKDSKLSELNDLRQQHSELSNVLSYAFFERKGVLRPPLDGKLAREYGTFVDPNFRFRLMHKGLFYSAPKGGEVRAVYEGHVVLASQIPGYGKTVIIDHGDNYYSVYAFSMQLKVREGAQVHEGDLVAISGQGSPLFGPGLYFEIRHFTDAIDPRPWIKESLIKTANADE